MSTLRVGLALAAVAALGLALRGWFVPAEREAPAEDSGAADALETGEARVVRGRVVDAFTTPLAGCRVHGDLSPPRALLDPATARPHGDVTVLTREDGRFEAILGGAADRVALTFAHADFAPTTLAAPIPGDVGDVVLRTGLASSVVVRSARTGAPIGGAAVSVRPELVPSTIWPAHARALQRTATTDTTGTASITGLEPGPYRIVVTADDHARFECVVTPGAATPTAAALEPAFVARGQVVDDAGAPVEGAEVTVLPLARPGAVATAQTDPLGRFRITRLAAGPVAISATAPGRGASPPLELDVPVDTALILQLSHAGIPAPDQGRSPRPASSHGSLSADPPTRTMPRRHPSPPLAAFAAEVLGDRTGPVDLEPDRGSIGPSATHALRGTVVRPDGTPAAGAIVTLDGGERAARADLHGRFVFESVRRGRHVLAAVEVGDARTTSEPLRVDTPTDRPCELLLR